MTHRRSPILLACLLVASMSAAASLATPHDERVLAAFVLALGRLPAPDETAVSVGTGARTIEETVASLSLRLRDDAPLRRATLAKSIRDAFGREPTAAEQEHGAGSGATYVDLMRRHVQKLGGDPEGHAAVIDRAYRRVAGRAPHAGETDYWRARPAVPFALMAACIENWATRNSPGLTTTTGTPSVSCSSAYLVTVRLAPAAAREARLIAGLPVGEDASAGWRAALGRHVIAAGAGELASVGGIPFVAAGAEGLLPGPESAGP